MKTIETIVAWALMALACLLLVALPSLAFAGPVIAIAASVAGAQIAGALFTSTLAQLAFRVGFSLIVSSPFGRSSACTDSDARSQP